MRWSVHKSLNVDKLLAERGLGRSHKADLFLGETVRSFCADYVPVRTGALRDSALVTAAGDKAELRYRRSYAREVYIGVRDGRVLHFRGAPLRGAYWDVRMMASRGGEVTQRLADFVGGEVK